MFFGFKMKDIDERISFWNEKHVVEFQGASPSHKFLEDYLCIFENKRVMEIGPGEGRQFLYLKENIFPSKYAVMDISPKVLENEFYRDLEKYQISSYKNDFGSVYDIIHFWYVIHHILFEEIPDFKDFLLRHLSKDGDLIFNVPYNLGEGSLGDDGKKTSSFKWQDIKHFFMQDFNEISTKVFSSDCQLIHLQRKV